MTSAVQLDNWLIFLSTNSSLNSKSPLHILVRPNTAVGDCLHVVAAVVTDSFVRPVVNDTGVDSTELSFNCVNSEIKEFVLNNRINICYLIINSYCPLLFLPDWQKRLYVCNFYHDSLQRKVRNFDVIWLDFENNNGKNLIYTALTFILIATFFFFFFK